MRPGSRLTQGTAPAAAVILLAAYGWFLLAHNTDCIGGSDSSGYINAAHRLATATLVTRPRGLDRTRMPDAWSPVFIPLGFAPGPAPGTMAPFYPCGYPAHMALAALALGWRTGPYLISPLFAVATLALFFVFARHLGLGTAWAVAGTVILGAWPIFLFQAIQPMSDIAATFWSLAAVVCAVGSSRRPAWALAAGSCFGIAVLVRPTDALIALPLLLAFPFSVSRLALFTAGGLPFAGLLAAYDLRCYGAAFQSGYQKGTLASDLALRYFTPRFLHYAGWTARTLTPLVPLAWASLVIDRVAGRRERFMLLIWFAAFFLFYCFYQPYDSFTFVRYLLPAAPALVAGALLASRNLLGRLKSAPARTALATVLLAAVLLTESRTTRKLGILSIGRSEEAYPQSCALAVRQVPAGSVVLAMQVSGSLEWYTNLSYARWDQVDPDHFLLLRGAVEARGNRLFALVFPFELEEMRARAPGKWKQIGKVQDIELLELAP